jgi:putative NADPH-quinone reductase
MTRIVAILGSSRADGDTKAALDKLRTSINFDIVDLNDYNISYYDYEHKNQNDDYLPLMHRLITGYDTLIIATPVYWYAMSGIIKVFFDRITDLLDMEKDLGRQLRGKSMAALSCSVGGNLNEHFWLPISETANYLGMKFLGGVHLLNDNQDQVKLTQFVVTLKSSKPMLDVTRSKLY